MWMDWRCFLRPGRWRLGAGCIFLLAAAYILGTDAPAVEPGKAGQPLPETAAGKVQAGPDGREDLPRVKLTGRLYDPFVLPVAPPVAGKSVSVGPLAVKGEVGPERKTVQRVEPSELPVLTGIVRQGDRAVALLRLGGQGFSGGEGAAVGPYRITAIDGVQVFLSGPAGNLVLEMKW